MNRKKQIKLFLAAFFWIAIYFLAKSQKLFMDKIPYVYGIIYVVFFGHIFYEGIYKKKKIENKKTEIKSKHLYELKAHQTNFIPEITNQNLPTELVQFIPLIKKWGIDNKILRQDLYENAKHNELVELKSIEDKREIIEKWVENNSDNPNISKALKLTLKSYDDLGLWTWET